ncbi:TetR/AcrR family transcriptional regulator [Pseudonocardia eucalypti]|uniref:TetR/AcrR family transcriptional regulator n=1 Tax=Pseudonocardia eucalypti TaxID=648755 RepID=A0ABP9PDK0_9PSEU|nr:AcrR family transcriptional regulator [Pseudonocardia eucalypti]
MGNREDLVAGARRCLLERGYARTTVRDIAGAAGVSMAAIGYHYGSKEALLNAALMETVREWGDELARALSADPGVPADRRFAATWTRVVESFERNRPMWAVVYEVYAQIDHASELRQQLVDGMREGRLGLAQLLGGIDPARQPAEADTVGAFYQALLIGVMMQWLVDPESAPTGERLAEALRLVSG